MKLIAEKCRSGISSRKYLAFVCFTSFLGSLALVAEKSEAAVWDARWTMKITDQETLETRMFRIRGGAVDIPTPDGIICHVSGVDMFGKQESRSMECKSINGILVTAKTYVICGPERSDARTLSFSTAAFVPDDCQEDQDDRVGIEFCLPRTEDTGVDIELRCD
jgi:hypothetical protein